MTSKTPIVGSDCVNNQNETHDGPHASLCSPAVMTPSELDFCSKVRGNAAFLRANFDDLSEAEANVIVNKLMACAEVIEKSLSDKSLLLEALKKLLSAAVASFGGETGDSVLSYEQDALDKAMEAIKSCAP